MARYVAIFIFALLFSVSQAFAGEKAPDFTLPTANGKINLASLQGKVVYVDFWASWCGPCRKSFPWMNKAYQRFKSQGFEVVAVNLDSERDLVDEFLKKYPASFTIAFDPEGSVAEKYDVKAMPSSYLIDKQGNVSMQHYGFHPSDAAKLEGEIASLLKQ